MLAAGRSPDQGANEIILEKEIAARRDDSDE